MTPQKKEDLLNEALNEIDESFIEQAASVRKKKKKSPWIPVLAAAALLIAAAAVGIPAITRHANTAPNVEEVDTAKSAEPFTNKDAASFPIRPAGELVEHEKAESPALHGRSDESDIVSVLPKDGSSGSGTYDLEDSPYVPSDELFPAQPEKEPDPGQMTAGAWDDNLHYALFRTLFRKEEQGTAAGKFASFAIAENQWFEHLLSRIRVHVTNGADPVAGIPVALASSDDGPVIASAVTDVNGFAFFFYPTDAPYQIRIEPAEGQKAVFNQMAGDTEVAADFSHPSEWAGWNVSSRTDNVIELMFVLDVTGSMGDELSFLKSELADVVKRVTEANPEALIRLSFLCYRDDGDEEKFFYADFTDVSDPAGMKAQLDLLKLQDAMGGGDYEEAVDEALMLAVEKGWSENSTKLVFHFLDAPAHDTPEHRANYVSAVRKAAEKGIRFCPVIASGSDTKTEYLTRSEALLTGGTFVFITDDSGIGNAHHEPNLPDAVHEYLNALMVRLINGYYTGTFADPVAWNAE